MNANDDARQDQAPLWLDMAVTDFDAKAPMTQAALFAEPDKLGTPTLFGDAFGIDLA